MVSKWARPADVPFPQVWARFQGPRPMADGRVPTFWIQDVREEDDDTILDIMKNQFLREEVIATHLKGADDPDFLAECEVLYRNLFQQRLSIALWADYPDGKPRIVGCNLLVASCRDDPKIKGQNILIKKALELMEHIEVLAAIHDRYGVDNFLSSLGLYINKEFRGMGLGIEMLKARVPICQAMGFEVTATLFSTIPSQKQSDRAGFHLVVEYPYAEFRYNGEAIFNITEPPTAQEKAMRIPPKS